ncbi:hydrogenase maturation protease [Caedibacter taeniospiralis]|uniref:hydrogenase maturation protease n=1 Tax=Caedibacter taeniospiralis TaxID=28907 RepID=UPI000C27C673|nr:hydrogenase maturation protease [Caedibacter taeniospiralis]
MAQQKILILGIGSPFGDDQFGWLTVRKVKEMLTADVKRNIDMEIVDRPGLNLLRFLEINYAKIILIDAVNANVEPGRQFYLKADEIIEFTGFLSSHNIGVAPSLALAFALDMPIKHIVFYGVQGERLFVKDNVVSQVVEEAVIKVAHNILSAESGLPESR